MTNLVCRHCPEAHDGLNGRYCNVLRRYVEYDRLPKCNNRKRN